MRKKRIPIIILAVLLVTVFLLIATDSRLRVVSYTVKSEKLSSEIKLALITDLHNCLYGENQSQLIQELEKESPDAVLLGGDIFDDDYINSNGYDIVKSLARQYKTYYVSGNHEWWSGEMYALFDYLESVGVTVLRGDFDILEADGNKIAVCGVDDPSVNVYDEEFHDFDTQLELAAEGIDGEVFSILLAHRPDLEHLYFKYDFDLVLSGHAHGGQVRIPYILNGLYAPNQGVFPKLAGGRYDFEKGTLIVSRGLSKENTIVPRVFNRPELVFVLIGG